MSVMMISPAMIADAHNKAQWFFKDYRKWDEDASMCPILAKMSEKQITQFFMRLYRLNSVSYDVRYKEKTELDLGALEKEFSLILKDSQRAKKIDIFQFICILRFLEYNIEFSEIRAAKREIPMMDSDEKLLKDIISEICYMIVVHRDSEKAGVEWYY